MSGGISHYWEEIKITIYTLFVSLNVDIDVVKILSILMITDTILGVIKSMYVSKLNFYFKILLWGIVTKCTVLTIPMILALSAKGLGYNFTWIVDAVLKIIIVSETISSITNILAIKEKRNIKNTDYISKMLHLIRDFFINLGNKFILGFKNIKDDENS